MKIFYNKASRISGSSDQFEIVELEGDEKGYFEFFYLENKNTSRR